MKHNVRLLTLATAVLAGGMVLNTHAANGPLARRGAFIERAKEKLEITDAQAAKIKSAVAAEKDSVTDIMRRLHSARADLRETLQEPNASEMSIRGAAARLAAAEADAVLLRSKLYKNVSAVLTPDQVAKLKEMQGRAGSFVDHIIDRVGERLSEQ